jgi:cellulose synthase/poly-beta-1,6-N-acetylglucosamine synthase-like glycosyltransferase
MSGLVSTGTTIPVAGGSIRSGACAIRPLADAGDGVGLAPLHTPARRLEHLFWGAVWAASLSWFWSWWFDPAHVESLGGFLLISLLLAWVMLLPLYFLVVFAGARRQVGPLRLPSGSRIAMVVTKAPSEPFDIVRRTLKAMLAQDVTHDTWLADEDPTPETLAWCARHGVRVSTRRGRPDYHRPTWPRRTRCKEGNLAFFYDHYGYDGYDFVVQLDADHFPAEGYLREMLKPFADPSVGYVSAPSICDANARRSWSARGRLYLEASLHGALQAGYNGGWAPLCIGSHYAVRTRALQCIGGLGPELAEDHSTTLMMNANGWRGVHAIDAIAHGDGPRTFSDLATQEFQWSRSLVTILLQYSPALIRHLPARLRFQFLFSQLWYPLFSLSMAVMFALPIVALLTGINYVNVAYPAFLLHFVPCSAALVLMAFRWRAAGHFRPHDARVLSWEGTLFLFARWPWSLWGCVMALRDWLTGSFVDFRVTPKGRGEVGALPWRAVLPYAGLALASALTAFFEQDAEAAQGFYGFAIVNAFLYAGLFFAILGLHAGENGLRLHSPPRGFRVQIAMGALLLALPAAGTAVNGARGVEALTWGAPGLKLTRTEFRVAGAGQGGTTLKTVRFRRWPLFAQVS